MRIDPDRHLSHQVSRSAWRVEDGNEGTQAEAKRETVAIRIEIKFKFAKGILSRRVFPEMPQIR